MSTEATVGSEIKKQSSFNVIRAITHNTTIRLLLGNRKSKIGLALLMGYIFIGVFGGLLSPYSPTAYEFAANLPPSLAHPLGTTAYGQDVFSQILTGIGPTLAVGFLTGIIATGISVLAGLSAGFSSEGVSSVINAVTNVFLVIPGIVIIMLFGAFFLGDHTSLGYIAMIAILSLTGWAWGARTLRSQALSTAKNDFITSSLLIGEKRLSIILRQIIRAMLPIIVSNFFFTAIYGVMGLTFVEYLGVGNLLEVNLGTTLYWAINNQAYITGEWWWIMPPSILISLLMFTFVLINFGVDEVSNPSLRKY